MTKIEYKQWVNAMLNVDAFACPPEATTFCAELAQFDPHVAEIVKKNYDTYTELVTYLRSRTTEG